MKATDLLYDQMRNIFGQIYDIEIQNQNLSIFNPDCQRKPLKECVLTLFPSTKEDASLRIFKRPIVQENVGKGKAQEIIVEISPEYQEHLFRISPSLERCYIAYQKHHQTDFWAHVVCAANEEQRLRQEKLGFSAKDEHKDARNLIKDLYQQIAYKFSPLQKLLSDCLRDGEKHRDLLLSYGHNCSYDITKNNKDKSIKINDDKPNLMQRQYLANGVSIPEISFVNEVQPIVPTQFYGKAPDESQFYTNDEQFHLIRQINSFSMNVLKPLSNNVIPDQTPVYNMNVSTQISARDFNMNMEPFLNAETLQKKSFKDFKVQTIQERVKANKIDKTNFIQVFDEKQLNDFKHDICINYSIKSDDDRLREQFSTFQDFYEQFITFNKCFYTFLKYNDLKESTIIQKDQDIKTKPQISDAVKLQLDLMKDFLNTFDEYMTQPKNEICFLKNYPALRSKASNLSELQKKCNTLLEKLKTTD
ncbi:Conserved_hypothetical protein [Hexamita inflata]|uniref:Uncharacterized protein n=1 Tax=Hexamita inflata TaxID=28002 RepID=A0AA86PI52_9EUKA|nr:Conserved hypothetical protein [Hexamita inflata]